MDAKNTPAARQTMEDKVMGELRRHFRPEFLNRVDDTILFHSLDESHLGRIVDIQLDQVIRRVAGQQIHLRVNDSARKRLAEEGYDPQFGARPLKRAIQDLLLNPLAQRLLAGDFKPRDTVVVSADAAGDLEFSAGEAAAG